LAAALARRRDCRATTSCCIAGTTASRAR
jgi:hypothetical protein